MQDSTRRLYKVAANFLGLDNVTKTNLAREFNVPAQSVNNWEERGLPAKIAIEAEERYGVSPSWLMTGLQVSTALLAGQGIDEKNYIGLTYYNIQSSAGSGKVPPDQSNILGKKLWVLEDWALQNFGRGAVDKIRMIDNIGDSMHPTINDGDVLFVDITQRSYVSDGIYVLNWNDRLLTKRLRATVDGRLAITSDNDLYETEYVTAKEADQLVICGMVKKWWSLRG